MSEIERRRREARPRRSVLAGGLNLGGPTGTTRHEPRPESGHASEGGSVGSMPMPGLSWVDGYEPGPRLVVGVDLGQKRDPTTVAVVEVAPPVDGQSVHLVRFCSRLPLGTSYPDVVARLVEILERLSQDGRRVDRVYLDATGVGQPVVDLLEAAGAWTLAPIVPVYFTHGDRRTVGDRGAVTLGKAWLVSRLQVLLQGGRLKIPANMPERQALIDELLDYEVRVDENANDRYGAFKTGAHDDLVTAIGLACQDD